jgi:hypothetical protein
MQLAAVVLARVLAFVESIDLNPRGQVFYPQLVQGLVEKFGFIKFPQKPEDFNEQKGVEFIGGRWGDVGVEKVTIYQNGLLLDTRVSTAESTRILQEALYWAASTFGITYEPKMIRHFRYLSNLTFYSEYPILSGVNSPVSMLARRIGDSYGELTAEIAPWEPTALVIHPELIDKKAQHAPFRIERRLETAFAENKYFSEAPFATDVHLALLEQFESDVAASGG